MTIQELLQKPTTIDSQSKIGKEATQFLTKINPTQSLENAQKQLGHDFTVISETLQTASGIKMPGKGIWINHNDKNHSLHRKGVSSVGNRFIAQQPVEIYDSETGLAAHVLKAFPEAQIIGGYTKKDGSRIGLQILLEEIQPITNDIIQVCVLLETSFNSAITRRCSIVSNRLVCLNQMNISNTTRAWKVRNTKTGTARATAKNQSAFDISEEIDPQIESFNNQIQSLVKLKMNNGEASAWFQALITPKKDISENMKTRISNETDEFNRLLLKGAGAEYASGTRYAAWNALTNYTTHAKPTRIHEGKNESEVRYLSNLDGWAAQLAFAGFQQLLTH
jgi:hypothetical protein